MYSYYALRAMGYKPPRFIPMVITSMQLTQMIVGCMVNLWAYDYLQTKPGRCNISLINIKLSTAMYFSYCVLFAKFFYATYLSANARKGKQTCQKTVRENQQSGSDAHLMSKVTQAPNSRMATVGGVDKFKEQ